MTRAQAIVALLLAALVALGAFAFTQLYELRSEQEWVPATGEARRPWYAAERLMQSLGHESRTLEAIPDFATLDPHAVYVLAAGRTEWIDGQRAALERWVEAGGHLVMESNSLREPDPVFDAFGVRRDKLWYRPREDEPKADAAKGQDDDDDDGDANRTDLVPSHDGAPKGAPAPQQEGPKPAAKAAPKPAPKPKVDPDDERGWAAFEGRVGDGRVLRISMRGGESLSGPKADWSMHDEHGTHVLHFARGQGQVTAINDISVLNARALGKIDNAEFIGDIAALSPGAPVLFQQRGRLSLWRWLVLYALPVVVVTIVAVIAWIWRVGPRFGPIRHDGTAERRSLVDHLHASGRFLWDAQERAVLADAVRARVLAGVRREHAEFERLGRGGQRDLLVAALGIAPADAERLLAIGTTMSAADFVRLAATAAQIHRNRTSPTPSTS